MEDTQIYFGDAVKALDDNGRVGALGIRFSDGRKKDLAGEFFTTSTYLGPSDGDGAECTFDHGFPIKSGLEEYADHTFAPVKASRQKLGIWVETVLDLADDYEKAVFQMAQKGKLGWSSGSAGHRVRKDPKTGEIKRWPVAEWALTPRPCEPYNYGTILPLKSLASIKFVDLASDETDDQPELKSAPVGMLAARLSARLDDLVDDGRSRDEIVKALALQSVLEIGEVEKVLSGETRRPVNATLKAFGRVLNMPFKMLKELVDKGAPKAIKDLFAEELAGRTPSTWELQSIFCCVVKKIAEAAKSARAVGTEYDYAPQVKEAASSYLDALSDAALAQVQMYVDGESTSEYGDEFYLRSLIKLGADDFAEFGKSTDFDEHSQLVVTAFREIAARFRNNHEMRKSTKAGRVLSEKNRQRLATLIEQISAAVTDCQNLLEETQPMATDTEMRAALTKHLFLKHQRRKNGLQLGA